MIGTMASVMSSTIVNVAIPDMSQHFALGQDRAHWVSSGFMAAMTVSMLTTPWLLARFGYRQTYLICMWLLLLGGIGGGFANHFALVLVARACEGLAAGVVQPIPAIIILRAFAQNEQGRASGIFGMGVVLAPAIGPSIGGVLVDWFGWRSIFSWWRRFASCRCGWPTSLCRPPRRVVWRPTVAARRWTGSACCWQRSAP